MIESIVKFLGWDRPGKKESGYDMYEDFRDMDIFVEDVRCFPRYAHEGDAAMDARAYKFVEFWSCMNEKVKITEDIDEFVLHPGQRLKIYTGIKCNIPNGLGIFALSRSGISSNNGIIIVNSPGMIDNPYTGGICVVFANISGVPYTFKKWDHICQLLPIYQIKCNIAIIPEEGLIKTDRGASGFGQSGR